MCAYVCVHACVCVCVYTHVCVCVCTCIACGDRCLVVPSRTRGVRTTSVCSCMSHSTVVIECNVLTVHLGECGGWLLVAGDSEGEK